MVSLHAIFASSLLAGVLGNSSTAAVEKLDHESTKLLSISSTGSTEFVRREVTKHEHNALPVAAQGDLSLADEKIRAEQVKEARLDNHKESVKKTVTEAPAAGGEAAAPLEEMNQVQDDKLIGTDHICGGSGARLIESYPGPVGRLLVECRQSCMDDAACDYYAYWPEGKNGKNLDGPCKNQCYLYDRCSDSSSAHEQIANTDTCTVYLFELGTQTKASRPDYAKEHKAGAHSVSTISMLFFPVMLLMHSLVFCR